MTKNKKLCRCGSELPFEECCKKEIAIQEKTGIRVYPEKFIVNRFIKSSENFKRFWEVNRNQVTQHIHWFYYPTQGEKYGAGNASPLQIQIGNPELDTLDEYAIAHEFAHCIFFEQGFQIPKLRPKHEDDYVAKLFSSTFQSMLHDTLVQDILSPYYSMPDIFNNERMKEKEYLKDIAEEPGEKFPQLLWIYNYASAIIDWHQIGQGAPLPPHFDWYAQKYPNINATSHEIAKQIIDFGPYDTPVKMKQLFQEIINTQNLQQDIKLP